MSGGRFDYVQFRFGEIVESIRSTIANNDSDEQDDYGGTLGAHLAPDIIAKLSETADAVERAEKMVTRVDWLLSCDDSEDSFRRRWEEEGLNPRMDVLPCAARSLQDE
jgi:hypothetical protein